MMPFFSPKLWITWISPCISPFFAKSCFFFVWITLLKAVRRESVEEAIRKVLCTRYTKALICKRYFLFFLPFLLPQKRRPIAQPPWISSYESNTLRPDCAPEDFSSEDPSDRKNGTVCRIGHDNTCSRCGCVYDLPVTDIDRHMSAVANDIARLHFGNGYAASHASQSAGWVR